MLILTIRSCTCPPVSSRLTCKCINKRLMDFRGGTMAIRDAHIANDQVAETGAGYNRHNAISCRRRISLAQTGRANGGRDGKASVSSGWICRGLQGRRWERSVTSKKKNGGCIRAPWECTMRTPSRRQASRFVVSKWPADRVPFRDACSRFFFLVCPFFAASLGTTRWQSYQREIAFAYLDCMIWRWR